MQKRKFDTAIEVIGVTLEFVVEIVLLILGLTVYFFAGLMKEANL